MHHPPLLRPTPRPFPAAPISIPTPGPPGLRPSPLFVLRALYKCRMLVGLRRCKPFIFTNPRNEFFCAACHEEDGLVRADLRSHEARVHQDELILGRRASPRPYCMCTNLLLRGSIKLIMLVSSCHIIWPYTCSLCTTCRFVR